MLQLQASLEEINSQFNASLAENDSSVNGEFESQIRQTMGVDDYELLHNLPFLDGREIKGNVEELDPTVPQWAKEPTKPDYTAHEVGAVDVDDELSITEIDNYFSSVFGI